MTRRVTLRPQVPDDLRSIISHLEQHSDFAADRFIDAVFRAFNELAGWPGKGSPKQFRSARLSGVRSWSVPGFRNHLILYRPLAESIDVLAVVHGSRRIRSLLMARTPPA